MQGHKITNMHHHTVHVRCYMLCQIDKCFRPCFKLLNMLGVRLSGLAEKSWWTSRRSLHRCWISLTFSKCGNISGRLIFLNTNNFSGPVSVLHFSFFDSFPTQNEYPDIPKRCMPCWKVVRCCSWWRLWVRTVLSTRSSLRSSAIRRSIRRSIRVSVNLP